MGRWAGGWVKWAMGIKEVVCCDEHWVLYVSDESLNSAPENDVLCCVLTNWNLNKKLKKKKK